MRKIVLIILVVICLAVYFFREAEPEEIRVRIIPNSNQTADIEKKEEVKDVVLCYLSMVYDSSYEQCMSNIHKTYQELEKSLNQEFGSIQVSFNKHTLYNKTCLLYTSDAADE